MSYNPPHPQEVPPHVPQAPPNSRSLTTTTRSYKVSSPLRPQKRPSTPPFSMLHWPHHPSQPPTLSSRHEVERIKTGPLNLMMKRRSKNFRHRGHIHPNPCSRNHYNLCPLPTKTITVTTMTTEQGSGSPLPTSKNTKSETLQLQIPPPPPPPPTPWAPTSKTPPPPAQPVPRPTTINDDGAALPTRLGIPLAQS